MVRKKSNSIPSPTSNVKKTKKSNPLAPRNSVLTKRWKIDIRKDLIEEYQRQPPPKLEDCLFTFSIYSDAPVLSSTPSSSCTPTSSTPSSPRSSSPLDLSSSISSSTPSISPSISIRGVPPKSLSYGSFPLGTLPRVVPNVLRQSSAPDLLMRARMESQKNSSFAVGVEGSLPGFRDLIRNIQPGLTASISTPATPISSPSTSSILSSTMSSSIGSESQHLYQQSRSLSMKDLRQPSQHQTQLQPQSQLQSQPQSQSQSQSQQPSQAFKDLLPLLEQWKRDRYRAANMNITPS